MSIFLLATAKIAYYEQVLSWQGGEMANEKSVWFITGCSTGFGRALAAELLENGYRVAVTARNVDKVADLVEINKDNALAVALDVTNEAQVKEAVAKAEEHFGRIDVLVNNAGFGYFGSVEESDEAEVRSMFETNFWGLAAVTRAVLPKMREHRSGAIVNISSIGGFRGNPSVSYYNATKFAVNGFSEALAKEVKPLGIKVIIVGPSGFRTDWAGRSANDAEFTISDYAETAGAFKDMIRGYSGNQPGDPVRAAKAIIKTVEAGNSPLYLFLGKAALKGAREQIEFLTSEVESWAETTEGADYPESEMGAAAK
jgi:NAD(P)-dependent dehydrogenase (short-subunit alcohol dehydrogenase family)